MSLYYLCIEIRKNLYCANIFLRFDQSLTETEFLKINVDENSIKIKEFSTEVHVQISDFFNIEAPTISNLTVEECNASFRLTINNIKEIVAENKTTENGKIASALYPAIKENIETSIHCSNCKCNISGKREFKKIREFPSGTIDLGEFFCHHAPDLKDALAPRNCDLFYGFQFIILCPELVNNTCKEKNGHYYCRRCLQYLGQTTLEGKGIKLWTDTLLLNAVNDNDIEFQEIFKTSAFTKTCQLIHKIINDATISQEPLLNQMLYSKVLLEATFPNRKRKFLMLHILEKDLQALRNSSPFRHNSNCNNNNVLNVKLENFKCFKLLYRFAADIEDKDERNLPPLIAYWQQNIEIQSQQISPTLFSALLEELEENSLLLPEYYRYSRDSFQLSYIFYET